MTVWYKNEQGKQEFSGGKNEWPVAARTAENCPHFTVDDDDELVAEEEISCYNCRYRRWTAKAFVCLKM